jgi:hypothetical protein
LAQAQEEADEPQIPIAMGAVLVLPYGSGHVASMTCREQSVHAELNDQGPFVRDDYIEETLVALPCCRRPAGPAVA